jgi:hypothetical protein
MTCKQEIDHAPGKLQKETDHDRDGLCDQNGAFL